MFDMPFDPELEDRSDQRQHLTLRIVVLAVLITVCLIVGALYRYNTTPEVNPTCPGISTLRPGQTVTITCPVR